MPWIRCLCAVVGVAVACSVAGAQEWSRFRGPNGSGLSPDASIPVQWAPQEHAWKTPIPGVGHSSPVLWGDKLFVTSGDRTTGKRFVLCLNATNGRTLWTKEYEGAKYKTHNRNSYATSTPAVDAERLYLAWATPEQCVAMALDHRGETVWQSPLGPYKGGHGFGASPVVYDGLVFLGDDQDGGGSLIALEAATGKIRWRLPRQGKNATYSTPCIRKTDTGTTEVIFTNWQHGITAVDAATGKVAWEAPVFERDKQERAIASPVLVGDLVLGTCGFVTAQKHHVAVRPPSGSGKPVEAWRVEKAVSYLPTPLVKGDLIFLCSEVGMATCLKAATGEVVWQERLGGNFSASPVCAGEHIYCTSNEGEVVVLAASPEYKVLARNMLGEATQSTPALAQGKIFFRTQGHVIAIGNQK